MLHGSRSEIVELTAAGYILLSPARDYQVRKSEYCDLRQIRWPLGTGARGFKRDVAGSRWNLFDPGNVRFCFVGQ
jgi:hypothetical protein